MKSYLMIPICGLVFIAFNVWPFQTQTPQQKVQTLGILKMSEKQERTLSSDTIHVWERTLKPSQYVVVKVEQKGIDLAVRIVDPKGVKRNEFDSPTGNSGTEKAGWIADLARIWKVMIVPLDTITRGGYEIELKTLRRAIGKDYQIVQADSLENLAYANHVQQNYKDAESQYKTWFRQS